MLQALSPGLARPSPWALRSQPWPQRCQRLEQIGPRCSLGLSLQATNALPGNENTSVPFDKRHFTLYISEPIV